MPRHTIIGKGIAYVKPLDQTLPLRPKEIELENNCCCMEVHNTSDSTVEFLYGQEMEYFDARSKGLVQINNSKHFPIDTPYYGSPTYHYLHMGMGMSASPQIWQQFVDLVFQDNLIKRKQNFDVIMDDTLIHSTAEEHMDDLIDLFKVLRKYGLKLSPHKCQFFKKKIVYMGLEFQIQEDKVCYTTLKDKCDAIRNLESPKTLRQTRAFCGMVNFLSSFLLNLCRLLIPIYDLQKKAKKFKWTEEAERVFNDIKKLLINPPVLKAPTPDGLFHLESDTSREGMGGT